MTPKNLNIGLSSSRRLWLADVINRLSVAPSTAEEDLPDVRLFLSEVSAAGISNVHEYPIPQSIASISPIPKTGIHLAVFHDKLLKNFFF